MKVATIIVAAGKGKRFSKRIEKQYIEIGDKPILYYTIKAFDDHPLIKDIVLVVDSGKIKAVKEIINTNNLNKVTKVVVGGKERSDSVYNGLKSISPRTNVVLVHDGVRPLISAGLIDRVINATIKHGAVIPAVLPKATIKEISSKGMVLRTLNRSALGEVQTPQGFKYGLLLDSYKKNKRIIKTVTDDSSLVELEGHKVKRVKGEYNNVKITTEEDLLFVQSALKSKDIQSESSQRMGIGYDIHRLIKGRPLVLGGIKISSSLGLLGHSDADVLFHAITDAVLGAIGKRDIGYYFPDNDKKYKNKESIHFLKFAYDEVKKAGYKVYNLDSVIIAEKPKLKPYYSKIVKNISKILNLSKDCCTVKFTTAEEMGPIGNKEAIGALAVVTLKGIYG